jgi:hypothetical protein
MLRIHTLCARPRSVRALTVAVAFLAGVLWANTYRSQRKETTDMTGEAYTAWLDAMPIDEVRDRIEVLELQLSDLRVLERLFAVRSAGADGEPWPEPSGAEAPQPADSDHASSEPAAG